MGKLGEKKASETTAPKDTKKRSRPSAATLPPVPALPPHWTAYKTKKGKPYYHKKGAKSTQWTRPCVPAKDKVGVVDLCHRCQSTDSKTMPKTLKDCFPANKKGEDKKSQKEHKTVKKKEKKVEKKQKKVEKKEKTV